MRAVAWFAVVGVTGLAACGGGDGDGTPALVDGGMCFDTMGTAACPDASNTCLADADCRSHDPLIATWCANAPVDDMFCTLPSGCVVGQCEQLRHSGDPCDRGGQCVSGTCDGTGACT